MVPQPYADKKGGSPSSGLGRVFLLRLAIIIGYPQLRNGRFTRFGAARTLRVSI